MKDSNIEITNNILVINHLAVQNKDLAQFFSELEPDDLERQICRALEVGVFCLQRATASPGHRRRGAALWGQHQQALPHHGPARHGCPPRQAEVRRGQA